MKQFEHLLKSGLDIKTIIQLSFQDSQQIMEELEKGVLLSDALTQHEESLYFSYVELCAKRISLPKAIECANRMDHAHTGLKQEMLKRLAYPIFLYVFAYVLVLLFSNTIIPSMAVYAPDNRMVLAVNLLKIEYSLIMLASLYLTIAWKRKDHSKVYRRFIRKMHGLRKRNTYEFSILWDSLIQTRMSTGECFQYMSQLAGDSSVSGMAHYAFTELMKGRALEQVFKNEMYFDTLFLRYVEIGMKTSNMNQLLHLYQQKTEKDLADMMHRIGNQIQLFSYLSVGALVFVFYQVMLLPLNMLTTF